jgi:hypothetical protein
MQAFLQVFNIDLPKKYCGACIIVFIISVPCGDIHVIGVGLENTHFNPFSGTRSTHNKNFEELINSHYIEIALYLCGEIMLP